MTSVFHWDIFVEFLLGIFFSATFTWFLYLRRHRNDKVLAMNIEAPSTPEIDLVAEYDKVLPFWLDEYDTPTPQEKYKARLLYDSMHSHAESTLIQLENIPKIEIGEVIQELDKCARCLQKFGKSLEAHYEANPSHRKPIDENGEHVHMPISGFEIRSGEVMCATCGRPIKGLRRIAGHSATITHVEHGSEIYVQ